MVQVERSARVALEMLADAIRNASPGVPSGNNADGVGCTTFGAMQVTNSSTGPDSLELIYGAGGAVTSLRVAYNTGDTTMTVDNSAGLSNGDYVVISNLTQGVIVKVTTVNSTTSLTTPATSGVCPSIVFPTNGYAAGSLVIRAQIAKFYVDSSATVGSIPTLMMDPDDSGATAATPLADGVEDLQFAVGVDTNGDGTVTEASTATGKQTDEWSGNTTPDTAAPNVIAFPWRAIRVSLVTLNPEETNEQALYTRPALEDHAAAGAADKYRRRVLSATVEIRNLVGSP
jgi:hypothetical protein